MVYTTYMANIRNIPNDESSICILITRWKPRNTINKDKYKFDILWFPNLGPSELLLTRFKSGSITWAEYINMYLEEANNIVFKNELNNLIKIINQKKNVYLVCYEKDHTHCHRSILKEILNRNNIKCEELKIEEGNNK